MTTISSIAQAVRDAKTRILAIGEAISSIEKLGDKPEMVEVLRAERDQLWADLAVICPNDPLVPHMPGEAKGAEVVSEQ